MNVLRACIALTAVCFLVAGTAGAQQSPQKPQQREEKKTLEPVTGELVSLDTDSKTLVIKTAGDAEMKFSFSEETQIIGAEKGAAGLATVSGATITVTYQEHGTANVATKIEVQPKK
jgi:hypothetical protein